MTKVIIVSTVGIIYDGITSVILSYLKSMDLSELKVYVVATGKVEQNIRKQIEELGCLIVQLPNRRNETKAYALALAKYIRREKIQVIHAHGNSGTLAIEMVAGWLGGCKKRIAHSHNTKCEQIKADKLLRPIFNIFYTDALACGNEAGQWLFGNKPFTVLKNGRDTELFSYDSAIRNKVRNKYGIKDEIVIGHVGGMFKQKNHKFLIEIYREVIRKEPNAKCFMIGDGPLKNEIESYAAHLKENVFFVGTTDKVNDYLQAMDGMVLPSLFEGLPLVVIEWQINGLPCVLADTITKECAATETVYFMPLKASAGEWAEKILEMSKKSNRIEDSKNGVERIRLAGYDIKDSTIILNDIYLCR